MTPVLEARGLGKSYVAGDGSVLPVLNDLDLAVAPGEFVAITGESGTGKSTLLHLLGALDRPDAGTLALQGTRYDTVEGPALAAFRNRAIGFVFQFHHLLRDFSAVENVALPLLIGGIAPGEARDRATEALHAVGVSHRLHHRPGALSGGEQQRVAVARALVARPAVVLADEPSGNLDRRNAARLHALLASVARGPDRALVVVTHNPTLAQLADRVLILDEGRLTPDPGPEAWV